MDFKDIDNRKVSLLLLGTQIATGGAQKVLLDQAHWFHSRGHKVIAVFLYDKDGYHKKWQDVSPFPIVNLNAVKKEQGTLQKGFSILLGLWRLWQLLRREKIGVIESFTHDSNLLVMPLAWLAGVPIRVATHHGVVEGAGSLRIRAHAWVVNHFAGRLVAVSERIKSNAVNEGVRADMITIIPNGITPIQVEGVDRQQVRMQMGVGVEDVVLVSVGRLVYQKAHEHLINAISDVISHVKEVKVIICGDGFLRNDLEAQIKANELAGVVQLLGTQQDIARYLVAADIFVLPSRWEGLPIAMLEAMSAGLPVVATRVEGVTEVIQNGVQGILVPVGDKVSLAQSILQLASDAALRRRMGNSAKQRVLKDYSLDRMCQAYMDLMNELQLL